MTVPTVQVNINGNLVGQGNNTDTYSQCWGSQTIDNGKYYWEVTLLQGNELTSLDQPVIGVAGETSGQDVVSYGDLSLQFGDTIGVAYDGANAQLDIYTNNTLTTSNSTDESLVGAVRPLLTFYGQSIPRSAINFGQQPFVFDVPAGYGKLYQPGSNTPAPPLAMPSTASPASNNNAPATSKPSLNSAPKCSKPWHVSVPSKPMRSTTMQLTPS